MDHIVRKLRGTNNADSQKASDTANTKAVHGAKMNDHNVCLLLLG